MMGKQTLIEAEESSLWARCLGALRTQISESALNTWFSALEILESAGPEMVIGVPNGFVLEYVSHHYRTVIEKALEEILGHRVHVSFTVPARAPVLEVFGAETAREAFPSLANPSPGLSEPESQWFKSRGPVRVEVTVPLNPRYTFDEFVIGDCNQLAHAACKAVAEAPSHNNFNPLVLYGGTGMGKTHLVQAIAHFCIENETVRKVVYRTSEEFTREYIEYVQKNKDSRTFYQVYKDADILLIDDIQFLAGKQSTQDEFFNIFSILQSLNKQIVITSDRPPAEIKGLHTRLLSRFDTGLLADLQPPNLETRLAILQKKSEDGGDSPITGDVLTYVANQVTSNIRELEGTLIKLSAYASFTHMPITVDIAKQILGDTLRNVNQPVTIKRVLDQVALEYGTTVSLLTSQTRKKNVAEPRQIAMYLARQLTDNSLHTIGLAFGRDYSTVIHSIKKVEQCMERDADVKRQVGRLMEALG
jgi:chromosomal replication initiator protein